MEKQELRLGTEKVHGARDEIYNQRQSSRPCLIKILNYKGKDRIQQSPKQKRQVTRKGYES